MTDAQIRKPSRYPIRVRAFRNILWCFELPTRLFQTEKALTLGTFDLIRQLEEQGLFYAELRFAPQHYTRQGLTQQQTVCRSTEGCGYGKKGRISYPDWHSSVHACKRLTC